MMAGKLLNIAVDVGDEDTLSLLPMLHYCFFLLTPSGRHISANTLTGNQ